MTPPDVTVVMATYGRGRLILPSIRSVLAQRFTAFELRVVGDATPDDTGEAVRSLGDPRVHWTNLPARTGSQSGPNNAGVAAARGGVVAYLGHDDIWAPDHLERIAALMQADNGLDVAVSGAIYHMPNGMPGALVTGLFDDDAAKHHHFFPPSALAHRRSVTERIGLWRMPAEVAPPVDAEFLLRAAAADLRFASTGAVTVHKFAAGHRYLSYLDPEADEQEAMLAMVQTPGHAAQVAALVARAQQEGGFMVARHVDYGRHTPGELARLNAARKGAGPVPLRSLGTGVLLPPEGGPGALDWCDALYRGMRWTAGNPVPRLAIPVMAPGPARLRLTVAHKRRAALARLSLRCNGALLAVRGGIMWPGAHYWFRQFHTIVPLSPDRATVLHLLLDPLQRPEGRLRGLGLGTLRLRPAAGPG